MAADARPVLGIDLGGTKVLFAVVGTDGAILQRERDQSATASADDIVTQLIAGIEALRSAREDEISAVGVGVPGIVNEATGHVVTTPNLPLDGTDLGRTLTEACGIPVAVGNDVTLCTLGEARYGAGKNASSLVGIFVGTGIGGGLVVDGKLYTGARGAAGEIGHMLMAAGGPVCGCGREGCFEALASRTAIDRDIREAVANGRPSFLADAIGRGERLRSGLLRKALKNEDELVSEVMIRAAGVVGHAVANVMNLLDPDAVVLGGGVMEACSRYIMPTILEHAEQGMMVGPDGVARIVPSALGDDAGVMGAAAIAFEASASGKVGGAAAYTPQIEWIGLGEIQINGHRYTQDVVVRGDGSIKKRRRKLSRQVYGDAHMVSVEEVKQICRSSPHVLVVGTGTEGRLSLGHDACLWLDRQGIRFVQKATPAAVLEYKALKGPRALLLHLRD